MPEYEFVGRLVTKNLGVVSLKKWINDFLCDDVHRERTSLHVMWCRDRVCRKFVQVDGVWHGEDVMWYDNGLEHRRLMSVNGEWHGHMVFYERTGRLCWQGEYVNCDDEFFIDTVF